MAFRLKLISTLEKLGKPCDVSAIYLQASDDKLVSQSTTEQFHNVFKNMRIYKINGPHFLLQAQPKECVKTILESFA